LVLSQIFPKLWTMLGFLAIESLMISFKGTHFLKEIILYAVFFYVRYGVSYRDLEEIMEERGVNVDHATLNRWVVNYSKLITAEAKKRKRAGSSSWRVDETYVKVKGKWAYWYRAVDKHGGILDFMLTEQRNEAAATAFFKQAIDNNGLPHKVVMDISGANYAGIENINFLMLLAGWTGFFIEIFQVKYLNNIIEQDHRFIKKITRPMMGFKAFHSAQATLDDIEIAHMIRKKQSSKDNVPALNNSWLWQDNFAKRQVSSAIYKICDTTLIS
jgi:putative transposase